jgi:RNA polymerase sigma factor (sigma-70 family)
MAEEAPFREVMDLLKAGDEDAAAVVFNRYVRRLVGLAASRLPASIRAKEDPDDAVLSAMKSFFNRQRKGEFDPGDWDELGTLLTYLTLCKVDRRIRKYLAAKRDIRREMAAAAEPDAEATMIQPVASDPTASETAMLSETLQELMTRLDPADQQILALRLQGFAVAEIAAAVGKSERTVFRVLDDIRDHLRRLLGLNGPQI